RRVRGEPAHHRQRLEALPDVQRQGPQADLEHVFSAQGIRLVRDRLRAFGRGEEGRRFDVGRRELLRFQEREQVRIDGRRFVEVRFAKGGIEVGEVRQVRQAVEQGRQEVERQSRL